MVSIQKAMFELAINYRDDSCETLEQIIGDWTSTDFMERIYIFIGIDT